MAPVIGLSFNFFTSNVQKNYEPLGEEGNYIPLNLLMLKRDKQHYLNVNHIIDRYDSKFIKKEECIILKKNMFGVTGTIKYVEGKEENIKVSVNMTDLQETIQHPFIGQQALNDEEAKKASSKRFYSDNQI